MDPMCEVDGIGHPRIAGDRIGRVSLADLHQGAFGGEGIQPVQIVIVVLDGYENDLAVVLGDDFQTLRCLGVTVIGLEVYDADVVQRERQVWRVCWSWFVFIKVESFFVNYHKPFIPAERRKDTVVFDVDPARLAFVGVDVELNRVLVRRRRRRSQRGSRPRSCCLLYTSRCV